MKHRSIRLFLGLSGIVTALAFTSNSVLAANHGNYKNQNSTQTISEDVSDLVSGTKGKMQVYADHDDAVDVYMSFDNYKKAMELNAEQIDANTENIATESDVYSSSKTYKQGGLCIKDGSLYQCTSEITTPEAWNSSHWKRISLSDAFNSLNKDLIETKKSVSDGKSAIASAITEKGVSTESDATFEDMIANINSISNSTPICPIRITTSRSGRSYQTDAVNQSTDVIGCITENNSFEACSLSIMSTISNSSISGQTLIANAHSSCGDDVGDSSSDVKLYYYSTYGSHLSKDIIIKIRAKSSHYYGGDSDQHSNGGDVIKYVKFGADNTVSLVSGTSGYTPVSTFVSAGSSGRVSTHVSAVLYVYTG